MVKIGKSFIYLLLLCSITSVGARTLVTDSFLIRIGDHCEKGQKVCQNISFLAIRKADNVELSLRGNTLNRKDSQEPYGYTFNHGDYTYSVFIAYAEIAIEKSGRMILFEKGEWLEDEEQLNDCFKFFLPENGLQYKDHLCFYKDRDISDVYQLVRLFAGNEYLNSNLELVNNAEYQISKNSKVVYNWLSDHELQITFYSSNQRTKFNFFQTLSGTQVSIRHNSVGQKTFGLIY